MFPPSPLRVPYSRDCVLGDGGDRSLCLLVCRFINRDCFRKRFCTTYFTPDAASVRRVCGVGQRIPVGPCGGRCPNVTTGRRGARSARSLPKLLTEASRSAQTFGVSVLVSCVAIALCFQFFSACFCWLSRSPSQSPRERAGPLAPGRGQHSRSQTGWRCLHFSSAPFVHLD